MQREHIRPAPAPTAPADLIREAQWRELHTALGHLKNAEFEVGRGGTDAALTWLGDLRRSLGALALLCADGPDAVGYARLLGEVLTPPQSGRGD